MGALADLKKLVMEGYIEKEKEFTFQDKAFKMTLRTLTMVDEMNVMRNANLTELPTNNLETMTYIYALLPYAIKKINGEEVVYEQVKDLIEAMPGDLVGDLYKAYAELHVQELKAGEEIKNS
jgi:hypothetical protein